jgi:hypothetical protein
MDMRRPPLDDAMSGADLTESLYMDFKFLGYAKFFSSEASYDERKLVFSAF